MKLLRKTLFVLWPDSESESDTLENFGCFPITINKLLSVKSAVITPTSPPTRIIKVKTGEMTAEKREEGKNCCRLMFSVESYFQT